MRNAVLTILSVLCFSSQSFAGGKVIGNGGDSRALEFIQSARQAILEIKKDETLYPELKSIDLEAQLNKTEVLISEVPVYSLKGELRQFSTAINYRDPDTIVVYGPQWDNTKNTLIRRALALHEVLSLASLEDTGVYTISQKYLAKNGITCLSGVCENLPRYNCTLTKMPHNTNMIQAVGATRVGYELTTDEIKDIFSDDMKATIVMNTTAANGHVMILLYQNGRTVSFSELRGSNFPPSVALKWKDVNQNISWTVSCTQN